MSNFAFYYPEYKALMPSLCVSFSTISRQQIATGDATGTIMVWQLPEDLTTQGAREVETLADLANAGAE